MIGIVLSLCRSVRGRSPRHGAADLLVGAVQAYIFAHPGGMVFIAGAMPAAKKPPTKGLFHELAGILQHRVGGHRGLLRCDRSGALVKGERWRRPWMPSPGNRKRAATISGTLFVRPRHDRRRWRSIAVMRCLLLFANRY